MAPSHHSAADHPPLGALAFLLSDIRTRETRGLGNAEGVMLSLPKKQEVMVYLKQLMQEGRLHIPHDPELINEMNVERYELTKTGQMQFSHPSGTQHDRLWALALAVYASRPEIPEYHPVVLHGKSSRLTIGPRKGNWEDHLGVRRALR